MATFVTCRVILLLTTAVLLLGDVALSEEVVADDSSDSSDSTLNVLFCCGANQDLDKPGPEGQVRCVPPSGNSSKLEIYSPSEGKYLENIPSWWSIHEGNVPTCADNQVMRYVKRSKANPYIIFDSGLVLEEIGSSIGLGPNEYCLGSSGLMACMPRAEGHPAAATMKPRLRKCCGENAAYEKNACVGIDHKPVTMFEKENLDFPQSRLDLFHLLGINNKNSNASIYMDLIGGFPICQQLDNFTIIGDIDSVLLQVDASLIINGQHIPAEDFCIEHLRVEKKEVFPARIFACSEHAYKGFRAHTKNQDIRFILYPVGLIISAIFLAATLAAGCLLPASHHVLHWRCQTHHVACLMLGDICMAVIQLGGDSLEGEFCRALAILAHFFFLATFFWLNTMCFNIWWTFRDLRPASLEKNQELLRLKFYAAFAWGGPLIIAGLAAILDRLPQTPDQTFLRPHFGETHCWFIGEMEKFAYFYGPIGALLLVNLIFFAATAHELTCGLWKGEFVKSTTERAALGKVCLKLVVVMGVPWIFDVISWSFGGPNFFWYVTDLLNALQGVFIFMVVGCQPQVRAALKRIWSRNPRARINRQGNGLSTTSHGIPSYNDSLTQTTPTTKTVPLETIC